MSQKVTVIYLSEIITASAKKFSQALLSGDVPAGHNGPYMDKESPVRVLSHWTIVFLKAHALTGLSRYLDCAVQSLEILMSKKYTQQGFTHIVRHSQDKTKCNGLIGPAWVMEAMHEGANQLNWQDAREEALRIYRLHPFDIFLGLWKIRECDGKVLGFDFTTNHQVWFASQVAGLLRPGSEDCGSVIDAFMDKLRFTIRIHRNGMIKHAVWGDLFLPAVIARHAIKQKTLDVGASISYLRRKEVGYHAFNLYAMAELNRHTQSHGFWSSDRFQKIVEFAISKVHRNGALTSEFGSRFNPSGIELAYFLEQCGRCFDINTSQIIKEGLNNHFNAHLDTQSLLMTRNCSDYVISAARIYEACRLPNYKIEIRV